MKKTIYLHIGMHKAASTTIQKGLFNNRKRLISKGYYIPEAGCPSPVYAAHHNAAWKLRGDPRYRDEYGAISEILNEIDQSNCPNAIISSEDFSFLGDKEKNSLQKGLSDYDVQILVYLREQSSWLRSIWSQRTKKLAHSYRFEEWMERTEDEIWRERHAENYLDFVERWNAVFPGKITVRVLEKGQIRENAFYDFLYACQTDDPSIYKIPENLNISPSRKTLEYIRILREKLKENKIQLDQKLEHHLIWFITEYGNEHWPNEAGWSGITREYYQHIQDRYQESNHLLAQKYLSREELFLSKPKLDEEIEDFTFSASDLFDVSLVLLKNTLDWTGKS